jgi:hypothetical protein
MNRNLSQIVLNDDNQEEGHERREDDSIEREFY